MMIGRVGTTIPVDVGSVEAKLSGKQLQLSGVLAAVGTSPDGASAMYTPEELKILRWQLLGLGDDVDEVIVPVQMTSQWGPWGDRELDGFYRVAKSEATMRGGSLAGKGISWSAELELVDRLALVESHITAAIAPLPSGFTFPNARPVWGTPAQTYDMRPSAVPWTTGAYPVPQYLELEAGSARRVERRRFDYPPPVREVIHWSCTPGDWYAGSCYVAAVANRGTPDEKVHPIPGRSLPYGLYDWEVGNGLVRLRPSLATLGSIEFCWRTGAGSAWTPPVDLSFATTSGATVPLAIIGVSIVRNAPHLVSVRLILQYPDGAGESVSLVIRRGISNFRLGCVSGYSTSPTHQLIFSTAAASSGSGYSMISASGWTLVTHQAATFNLASPATATAVASAGVTNWTIAGFQSPVPGDWHPAGVDFDDESFVWVGEMVRPVRR